MAYGKSGNSRTKMFCSLRKFMVMFDEEHKGTVTGMVRCGFDHVGAQAREKIS